MSLALGIGIAIAMPIIVYQIVAFFAPGLYAREKRIVFTALPFVFELFWLGWCLAGSLPCHRNQLLS